MKQVMSKVFVVQYYKINTGFFLASFILLFGLTNGKATLDLHYTLMQQITSSYAFAGGAVIVWVLYCMKCMAFCFREIKNSANSFLSALQPVADQKHYLLWLSCQSMLMLPMLGYAGATVIIGFKDGNYLLASLFTLFQLLLCIAPAYFYFHQINNTWQKPLLSLPDFSKYIRKGYYSFLLHYSLDTRKGTIAGLKIFSLLLLQAMVIANKYEVNKESVCVLMMFLISAHALLPQYYTRFVEYDMAIMRNLPILLPKRFLLYVFTYAVLFLPELLFLLLNGHHSLPVQLTLSLYAVGISQLSLFTAFRYFGKMNTERYTLIVFGFFFVSLLVLASFNLWLLFLSESIAASILFRFFYPGYEYCAPKS